MATTIRSLLVRLGVKADSSELSKFDAELSKVKRGMAALAKMGAVVSGALGAVTAATLAAGDAVGKGADRARLGVEAYQELGAAAEDAGSSAAALERATAAAAVRAANYRHTTEDAARGLADLSDIFRDANGEIRSQEEILYRAADAIAAADNETEKLSLSQRVFSEGGRELLPLLQGGADGIRRLREEARATGVVMSEDLVRSTERVNDDLADLRRIGQGLVYTVGGRLIPVLSNIIGKLNEWYTENGRVLRQGLDRWAEKIADAFETVADNVEDVVDLFGGAEAGMRTLRHVAIGLALAVGGVGLVRAFTALSGAIGLVKVGLPILSASFSTTIGVGASLTAGLAALKAGFLAAATGAGAFLASMAPFIAAVSGAVLVGLALAAAANDITGFFLGADSVLGRFLARTKAGQSVFSAIQGALASIGKALDGFITRMGKAPAAISAFFAQLRTGIPLLDSAAGLVEMLGVGTAQLAGDAAVGLRGAVGATDAAFARGVAVATPPSPTQGAGLTSNTSNSHNTVNQNLVMQGVGISAGQAGAVATQTLDGMMRQATGVL